MSRGLNWQTIQVPFTQGLETKGDVRASSPPDLDIARDLQFEEPGGLQTRKPFATLGNAIFGGGTLSNCRRLAVVNDELVAFTDVAAYSWDSEIAKWVSRGTHLGVKTGHEIRFASVGDQIVCDRAELNGTIVMTWVDGASVWVAALSKATGAVLMVPTSVTGLQSRLVALSTKILFFLQNANTLSVRALDPTDPATGFAAAATNISVAMFGSWDATRVLGADQAVGATRLTIGTSYVAFTVTAGLVLATSTKARQCDGRICVASRPSAGTQTHVFRCVDGTTAIVGDVLTTSTLADVTANQAIGTYTTANRVNALTACYRSVQTAGKFVCVVFWSSDVNTSVSLTPFDNKTNTVDDTGTIGAQATFVTGVFVASRAFDYAGSVFANMQFNQAGYPKGGELNSQYFLYKEDRTLHGKMVSPLAGALTTAGVLPGVASIDGLTYRWAGAMRRIVSPPVNPTDGSEIVGGPAFGARSPVDITITFDSNEARRVVQIGRTGYIAGGEVLQYDGVRLVEVGFSAFQYACNLTDAGPATGSVAAGTYFYKSTFSYVNAQGETERSTTGTVASVVIGAAASSATSVGGAIGALYTSRKTAILPTVEVWRTPVAPNSESPFYLVTSLDPSVSANPNRYLANNTAGIPTFTDALADATVTTHAANQENGGVLESLAPPSATIIVDSGTRLFLGGVAGDADRIWYSRERNDGEIASFHDGLTIDILVPGGNITALWFQDGVLFVSRETAIYALPGTGFDNLGQGTNFGPARTVSLDVGAVSQEAQAATPIGTIFKSRKGYQLLDRGGQLRYIGGPVALFDADTVYAMHAMTAQHQVRILTSGRVLIWDYRGAVDANAPDGLGQWAEWTITDGVHATMWNGSYAYLTATGPKIEQSSYTSLTYGLDVETSWLKPNGLTGFAKLAAIQPLGEYRSTCLVRMRVARDYQYDGAGNPVYFDDIAWSPSPAVVGSALQFSHSPTQGQGEAYKVRLTAVSDLARATLVTTVLSPQVSTDGTAWNATWQSMLPGEMGNALTMTVSAVPFVAPSGALFGYDLPFSFISETGAVVVNDHFTWSPTLSRWREDANNIGVTIAGTVAVSELEAAVAASTGLATLLGADASPTKTIAVASMLAGAVVASGAFAGGAYGAPSGEAVKFTGVGFELGIDPRLYRRLPAEQKT